MAPTVSHVLHIMFFGAAISFPVCLLVGVPEDDEASWCPCGFRPLGGNAKTLTAPPQRITEAA